VADAQWKWDTPKPEVTHSVSVVKNVAFWMVAALVIILFWNVWSRIQRSQTQLAFSDFMARVEKGNVAEVTLSGGRGGSEITGRFKSGESFRSFAPASYDELVDKLLASGVELSAREASRSSWLSHLINWTPILIMIAFLVFFMRQMQKTPGRDSVARQIQRKEERLALKSRIFHVLSGAKNLSEDEIILALDLATEPQGDLEKQRFREAVYELISEGTIQLTGERKYRVRTHS
jgi:uncharacterized membrane protein YjfL (UPF0719 family)